MRRDSTLLYLMLIIAMARCTTDIAGGGSDLPDKNVVVGRVLTTDQHPAPYTQVSIIPADYNCLDTASADEIITDTTDSAGAFRFLLDRNGDFNIQAVGIVNRTRLLITGIDVADDSTTVPDDTLRIPGTVKLFLPECMVPSGSRAYLPGTTVASDSAAGAFVILDSVPAGTLTRVNFQFGNSSTLSLEQNGIAVIPGDTTVVVRPQWGFSKKLRLNTSASGADVAGTLFDFPVLIRLDSTTFNFDQADVNGADIRFVKNDNTLLHYETERWDAVNRLAEFWVRIDTVRGNDSTQSIRMCWGNTGIKSASAGAGVFDTVCGFQGVWHLGENDSVAYDATANNYRGNATDAVPVDGIIGNARSFNGSSSIIRMTETGPGSTLNFPANGRYTLSAWVYHDTLADSATYLIAGKGEHQYFMKTFDLSISTAQLGHQWEFTEYRGNDFWQASTLTPAVTKKWTHLVGVRDGSNQYLYVNGELAMTGYQVLGTGQSTTPRDTTDDFTIGGFLRPVAAWNQGYAYFRGSIDEVRVSSVPLSPDWIKLSYMNQKAEDDLVIW
jgi:hypothetical protein